MGLYKPLNVVTNVQAFVGGEAGLEGAEVPGERASKGVTFDSRRFWAELGDALGMPAGASNAYLGDIPSDASDDKGGGGSSDEGSSFFGDAEVDSDEEEEGTDLDEEALYRAQRAQRARSTSQQHPGGPSGAAAAVSRIAQEVLAGKGGDKPDRGVGQAASEAAAAAGAAGQGNGSSRVGSVRPPEAMIKPQATGAGTGAAEQGDQWETLTATDSDDEEATVAEDDAEFAEAYDQSMARELARSRVGASFGAPATGKSAPQGSSPALGQPSPMEEERVKMSRDMERRPAEPAGPAGEGEEDEEELTPVDVDLNLVESLLASYAGGHLLRFLPCHSLHPLCLLHVLFANLEGCGIIYKVGGSQLHALHRRCRIQPPLPHPSCLGLHVLALPQSCCCQACMRMYWLLLGIQSGSLFYAGQQGLPGPAGNLAALMGISLPDNEDSSGASPYDALLSQVAQPG